MTQIFEGFTIASGKLLGSASAASGKGGKGLGAENPTGEGDDDPGDATTAHLAVPSFTVDWSAIQNVDGRGDQLLAFLGDHTGSETLTGKVFDATDGIYAGWADRLTWGLTTRAREWMYGEAATRNHQGMWFQIGQHIGDLHDTLFMFTSPCGAGRAAFWGMKLLNTLQFVGASWNAYDSYQEGDDVGMVTNGAGALGSLGALGKACFAGDMEVITRRGWVRWDQLKEGDEVLSRDENDPDGLAEFKVVEEIFRTETVIWHVHLAGERGCVSAPRVIRTSSEHPFWVKGKGWTAANELEAGDVLVGHDGQTSTVEEVHDTGVVEPVYNARVAEYHTYFVGRREWGSDVWAHNACVYVALNRAGRVRYVGIANTRASHTVLQRLAKAAAKEDGLVAKAVPGLHNIPASQARQAEAALIRYFGREGLDAGGSLLNRARGTLVGPEGLKKGFRLLWESGFWGNPMFH